MDYTIEDFSKYKQYLNTISKVLDEYFEHQKEYICCKKGCGYCCERGSYPYTDLEFKYLLLGFFKLDMQEQQSVIKRIKKLKEEYNNCEDKANFTHRCPFLNDDKLCSVYDFRGLICRVFGLITCHEDGSYTLPFCQALGLNYSKVYDSETKTIDTDKIIEYGYKNMPEVHRTNLKRLMSPDFFEGEPIDFGEMKPLIEWL